MVPRQEHAKLEAAAGIDGFDFGAGFFTRVRDGGVDILSGP
jgi:hypothetical protein